jgi:uncharacterized membrane protein (DUF485 family)
MRVALPPSGGRQYEGGDSRERSNRHAKPEYGRPPAGFSALFRFNQRIKDNTQGVTHMGHGPAVKLGKDNASGYKSRIGISMFILYSLIYAGFVVISTTKPALLDITFGGLNVAVLYGMFLIIFAFILAFIYNRLCTKAEARLNK